MAVSQANAYHLVVVKHVYGYHAVGTRTTVRLKTCLLYQALLGGEHHIMAVDELFVVKTAAQTQERLYAVVALYVQQVLYGSSLRVLSTFGYLVTLQPVTTSLVREEHHGVVHRGRIDVLRKIIVTAVGALAANSTARLLTEF